MFYLMKRGLTRAKIPRQAPIIFRIDTPEMPPIRCRRQSRQRRAYILRKRDIIAISLTLNNHTHGRKNSQDDCNFFTSNHNFSFRL